MNFDLHSHSYYSDGELSPQDLVALAIDNDITHLALTDHDTTAGLALARQHAKPTDLTLINGVELSCTWGNQLLHIVGLDIDPENAALRKGIKENTQRRCERAEAMYEDFKRHDIELREAVHKMVEDRGVPTRPHFAQAIVSLGYAKDKKQAFKRYLVPGKPGFVPMLWPSLAEIAAWINAAGGVAVLAHPMRYGFTRTKLIRLIEEMKGVGVRGIEVSTPTTNKQQSLMLATLAQQHGLLASIGSDFHSRDQTWARIGSAAPLLKELTPVWTEFDET